ncbi:MAG TPA: hypothetical protein VNO30_39860 [Kofleriaceae bacterium]|nr:hypothetical protein [Kofleriaceae bacterium]
MPPRVALSTRMALVTGLCLLVHGCEDVNGGAVELSWKLRPASSSAEDKFVECDSDVDGAGPVDRMRLDWEVRGVTRVWTGAASWRCTANHGVTGFELPAGEALLTVTPLCAGGGQAEPSSYIAPAAEQRSVIVGDTISLGAVEIVVVVSECSATRRCICGEIAIGHMTSR